MQSSPVYKEINWRVKNNETSPSTEIPCAELTKMEQNNYICQITGNKTYLGKLKIYWPYFDTLQMKKS